MGESKSKEPDGVKLRIDKSRGATKPSTPAAVVSPPSSPSPGKGNKVKVQMDADMQDKFLHVDMIGASSRPGTEDADTDESESNDSLPDDFASSTATNANTSPTILDVNDWHPPEVNIDLKIVLPEGWVPSPDSVICGRGKECFEAEGVRCDFMWAWCCTIHMST
jgi:hypothetical protein